MHYCECGKARLRGMCRVLGFGSSGQIPGHCGSAIPPYFSQGSFQLFEMPCRCAHQGLQDTKNLPLDSSSEQATASPPHCGARVWHDTHCAQTSDNSSGQKRSRQLRVNANNGKWHDVIAGLGLRDSCLMLDARVLRSRVRIEIARVRVAGTWSAPVGYVQCVAYRFSLWR
jgi:hypothetical protein